MASVCALKHLNGLNQLDMNRVWEIEDESLWEIE